jgi:hypothetical protein
MIPDMSHFLVVYLILMTMVSALLVIVWGERVVQVSSLGDGLLNFLQYTLFADSVGDDAFAVSDGKHAGLGLHLATRNGLAAVALALPGS